MVSPPRYALSAEWWTVDVWRTSRAGPAVVIWVMWRAMSCQQPSGHLGPKWPAVGCGDESGCCGRSGGTAECQRSLPRSSAQREPVGEHERGVQRISAARRAAGRVHVWRRSSTVAARTSKTFRLPGTLTSTCWTAPGAGAFVQIVGRWWDSETPVVAGPLDRPGDGDESIQHQHRLPQEQRPTLTPATRQPTQGVARSATTKAAHDN